MPKENSLRDHVRDLITRQLGGFATNHEDKFVKGIGDTSFAISDTYFRTTDSGSEEASRFLRGWFELKNHHEWPKTATTKLKLGIRSEQRIWARERWKHGRDVFFLIRVASHIYMFTGEHTDELYFPIMQSRFEQLWVGKWQFKIAPVEFLEILREHL